MKRVVKRVLTRLSNALLTHGGPGRFGGGEEMGGIRGIKHYLQRTAIQGHPTTITKLTKQYQVDRTKYKRSTFLSKAF